MNRRARNRSLKQRITMIVQIGLCMSVAFCLVSCGNGTQTEQTTAAVTEDTRIQTTAVLEESTDGQTESVSAANQEPHPQAVPGVQLADPYGIFIKGQAPVYLLKDKPPAIETEGAKAWLESAIYFGGNLHFVVKIEDYSITVIPEDEVAELLEKQKENENLQDWSYFPIDAEQGIYGRSAFEDRWGFPKTEERKPGVRFINSIEGAGISGGSFNVDHFGSGARYYKEYLDKGYVTSYHWYRTDKQKMELFEPTGEYRIYIPGFADGFTMEFVKASAYEGVEDIPGMSLVNGLGIMATGEKTEEGLKVTYHTWTEGRYTMQLGIPGPSEPSLICRTAEGEEKGTYLKSVLRNSQIGVGGEILKVLGGLTQNALLYKLPDGFEQGEFDLKFHRLQLNSREITEWIKIPVPEEKISVDKTLEFKDCIIRVISAEKLKEPRVYSQNEQGEDILRPAIYLEVEVIMKDDSLLLREVIAAQEEQDPRNPQMQPFAYATYTNGHLKGVYAFYEEGEDEIQLRFESPSYKWLETLIVPVQMMES